MIHIRMGQNYRVNMIDPAVAQVRSHRILAAPAVKEHTISLRSLDNRATALTYIQKSDPIDRFRRHDD